MERVEHARKREYAPPEPIPRIRPEEIRRGPTNLDARVPVHERGPTVKPSDKLKETLTRRASPEAIRPPKADDLIDAFLKGRSFARHEHPRPALPRGTEEMFHLGSRHEVGLDPEKTVERTKQILEAAFERQIRDETESFAAHNDLVRRNMALRVLAGVPAGLHDLKTKVANRADSTLKAALSRIIHAGKRGAPISENIDASGTMKIAEYLAGMSKDIVLPPAEHARLLREMAHNEEFSQSVMSAAHALGVPAQGSRMPLNASGPWINNY